MNESELQSRPDKADVIIESTDGKKFALHSPLLQIRWPSYNENRNLAISKLSGLNSQQITEVMEYLYGGLQWSDKYNSVFIQLNIKSPLSPNQYKADMKRLYNSDVGTNFIINCHNTLFHTHRFMLAIRSGFFSALLNSGLSEAQSGLLHDCFAPSATNMQNFIEYLYTGDTNCRHLDDNFQLLKLCECYELYSGYDGEVEEFIVSNIIRNHISQINEAKSIARAIKNQKVMKYLDACEIK